MSIKLPDGKELVFVPGCFDDFEGTQEELDQMIQEITDLFTSGEALEKAQPISAEDLLEDLTPEEVEDLIAHLEESLDKDTPISVPGRNLQ